MPHPSGSGPQYSFALAAPWALPKVWPPALSATVSSSSMAMRREVSRMSLAAARAAPPVVHGHAAEGLPDVPGGGERVGLAVGPLRVHVDQAHLDGAERFFQ